MLSASKTEATEPILTLTTEALPGSALTAALRENTISALFCKSTSEPMTIPITQTVILFWTLEAKEALQFPKRLTNTAILLIRFIMIQQITASIRPIHSPAETGCPITQTPPNIITD